jgi:hypothetical protein
MAERMQSTLSHYCGRIEPQTKGHSSKEAFASLEISILRIAFDCSVTAALKAPYLPRSSLLNRCLLLLQGYLYAFFAHWS